MDTIWKINELVQYVILLIVILGLIGHSMYHSKKNL